MSPGEQLLRAYGLRVTRPRLTVLDVLTAGGHLEVEEIAVQVRACKTRRTPRSELLKARPEGSPAPAGPAGG